MSPKTEDAGVIEALLGQLNESRLPRLLELQERARGGEAITDFDLQLLEDVMHDIHTIQSLAQSNPELEKLYAQITALHADITAQALENEEKHN